MKKNIADHIDIKTIIDEPAITKFSEMLECQDSGIEKLLNEPRDDLEGRTPYTYLADKILKLSSMSSSDRKQQVRKFFALCHIYAKMILDPRLDFSRVDNLDVVPALLFLDIDLQRAYHKVRDEYVSDSKANYVYENILFTQVPSLINAIVYACDSEAMVHTLDDRNKKAPVNPAVLLSRLLEPSDYSEQIDSLFDKLANIDQQKIKIIELENAIQNCITKSTHLTFNSIFEQQNPYTTKMQGLLFAIQYLTSNGQTKHKINYEVRGDEVGQEITNLDIIEKEEKYIQCKIRTTTEDGIEEHAFEFRLYARINAPLTIQQIAKQKAVLAFQEKSHSIAWQLLKIVSTANGMEINKKAIQSLLKKAKKTGEGNNYPKLVQDLQNKLEEHKRKQSEEIAKSLVRESSCRVSSKKKRRRSKKKKPNHAKTKKHVEALKVPAKQKRSPKVPPRLKSVNIGIYNQLQTELGGAKYALRKAYQENAELKREIKDLKTSISKFAQENEDLKSDLEFSKLMLKREREEKGNLKELHEHTKKLLLGARKDADQTSREKLTISKSNKELRYRIMRAEKRVKYLAQMSDSAMVKNSQIAFSNYALWQEKSKLQHDNNALYQNIVRYHNAFYHVAYFSAQQQTKMLQQPDVQCRQFEEGYNEYTEDKMYYEEYHAHEYDKTMFNQNKRDKINEYRLFAKQMKKRSAKNKGKKKNEEHITNKVE